MDNFKVIKLVTLHAGIVRLSDAQAILGFPKYLTIGIGFAIEDDWNTMTRMTTPTRSGESSSTSRRRR